MSYPKEYRKAHRRKLKPSQGRYYYDFREALRRISDSAAALGVEIGRVFGRVLQ